MIGPTGTEKFHQIADFARVENRTKRGHTMSAVEDLPSDAIRGAAQSHAAQVGRSRAAHSGDAVASEAAFCLKCGGTALARLGTCTENNGRQSSK